jgi:mannose-1-phosphate guanylyltransferase
MDIIPVIMAGGAGTRLWPLSRKEKPKQFHNLSGEGTLLHETIERLKPLNPKCTLIVTSKDYEGLSREEIAMSNIQGVVLSEPRPRNTAPAILYSTVFIDKSYHESVMVVLPADHFIGNREEFLRILRMAIEAAESGSLVTIGIKPGYPETGYGYIKAKGDAPGEIFPVESFVEKPDSETAEKYLESGDYFWNSGIFVWKTTAIFEAFMKHLPDYIKAFEPLYNLTADKIESDSPEVWEMKTEIFNKIDPLSIDYGIMEKADNCMVIPADFGWADLGSWKSIDDILKGDKNNNRSPAKEKALFLNSDNCSVFSEESTVAVVGLSNVVVVQAGNNILVMEKDSSQDVKKVVELMEPKNN